MYIYIYIHIYIYMYIYIFVLRTSHAFSGVHDLRSSDEHVQDAFDEMHQAGLMITTLQLLMRNLTREHDRANIHPHLPFRLRNSIFDSLESRFVSNFRFLFKIAGFFFKHPTFLFFCKTYVLMSSYW